MDFFISMDIDKNGVVDFNEFMIAMNSETGAGTDGNLYSSSSIPHKTVKNCQKLSLSDISFLLLHKIRDKKTAASVFRFRKSTSQTDVA